MASKPAAPKPAATKQTVAKSHPHKNLGGYLHPAKDSK